MRLPMAKAAKIFWWPFILQVLVFVDVLGVHQHFKEAARPISFIF